MKVVILFYHNVIYLFCTLAGAGNMPGFIQNNTLFILTSERCTGRFILENLGVTVY